jgi:hypothetical protein
MENRGSITYTAMKMANQDRTSDRLRRRAEIL